ncbi:MAG TPA: transketolase [Spirochaetia bacterium]|nr:transketolase [Spirochaetia bacterium]
MAANKEMRSVYTETLIELAEKNNNIVVLEADLMKSQGTVKFMEKFPERTFNIGVAEANMVGIAAGLSALGKIPFAATFGCFAGRRVYDQFFISANYAKLNVKLVGSDPGVAAAYNGGTHMPFEDLGIMRNIPKCTVLEACDQVSLRKLMIKSAEHYGSVYMRLHRKPVEPVYPENEEFELGKGKVLKDGSDITIIANGAIMVHEALAAEALLQKEGIRAAIIDMHTIKPIDKDLIIRYAKKTKALITCENHQVVNGLGSAVAEVLSENIPTLMARLGINDEFGEVGTQEFLQKRFGLTGIAIAEKATELLKRKI